MKQLFTKEIQILTHKKSKNIFFRWFILLRRESWRRQVHVVGVCRFSVVREAKLLKFCWEKIL